MLLVLVNNIHLGYIRAVVPSCTEIDLSDCSGTGTILLVYRGSLDIRLVL